MTSINTMLSPRYVKNWGIFEGMREFLANAWDADPHARISFLSDSCICIETTTEPSLDNMVILGSGTKAENDKNIGQFGEGLKVAALALTRMTGLDLKIYSSLGKITFSMKQAEGLQEETLHLNIDDSKKFDNYKVIINDPSSNLQNIFESNFLDRHTPIGPIDKSRTSKCRIYVKNVFVTELNDESEYDWNLDKITINRDRNIPDMYSVQRAITVELINLMEKSRDWCATVLQSWASFEGKCLMSYHFLMTERAREHLKCEFYERWGENAVLAANDPAINNLAKASGKKIINLPGGAVTILSGAGVETADNSRQITQNLQSCSKDYNVSDLQHLLELMEISCNIAIFKPTQGLLGKTDPEQKLVWISEELFQPGRYQERLATFCHEVGHLLGGDDGSMEFENSLTNLLGRLAKELLRSKKECVTH